MKASVVLTSILSFALAMTVAILGRLLMGATDSESPSGKPFTRVGASLHVSEARYIKSCAAYLETLVFQPFNS